MSWPLLISYPANVGPWVRLAKELNLTIKYWLPTQLPDSESPFSIGLNLSNLEPLLSANTRLVAFTAVSNLLGHRTPVKDAVELIKSKTGGRAMAVVDCVAYAPHGRMDMQEWGCDAVLFSFYKVRPGRLCRSQTNAFQLFGPHLSCLALSPWSPLATKSHSLGHYFHPQAVAYKLAPGGAPYELQVGCHPVLPYLFSLGDGSKDQLATAFERIRAHERLLSERMLAYLLSDEAKAKGVQVIGPQTPQDRVPTISFVVVEQASRHGDQVTYKKRIASRGIVSEFDKGQKVSSMAITIAIAKPFQIGIKYGHFYSTKVLPCVPLDTSVAPDNLVFDKSNAWQPFAEEDGVVRVSLVHYNTLQEVDEIIKQLKSVLAGV